MERKPVNARNEIHHYYSKDISGWWIEPDLPNWAVNKKNGKMDEEIQTKEEIEITEKSQNKPNVGSANDLGPLLQKKIDYLLKKNIINQKKHADYQLKIADAKTGKGLLNYFLKQFDLLYRMHKLLELNKITAKDQKVLYQRIMQAKTPVLTKIDQDIHQMEVVS